jgi:hypothetical protein
MPESNRRTTGVFLCAGLIFAALNAEADNDIKTTISGYGTLGGTITSDDNSAYTHDPTEFVGAGHHIDIPLDSKIGVQAVIDFGSGFSVTAQEVARQRGSDNFSLGTEWLYLQYSPDSDWKFRLGRVALATFLFSESRNVGYAAPWFNAPNELYAVLPFQTLDGAQVQWHHRLGPVGLRLDGTYGNTSQPYLASGAPITVKVRDGYNIAAALDYGDFTFRVAQTKFDVPFSLPLSATYTLNFVLTGTYNTVGLQYDNGKAIVISEYAKGTQSNIPLFNEPPGANTAWYVAGGWRFGKWTPLLTYGEYRAGRSLGEPVGSYGTWSGSLRYEVARNVALKAQVSRPQAADTPYWTVANYASTERVNVYSLGADFVF